jgi:chromate transporter
MEGVALLNGGFRLVVLNTPFIANLKRQEAEKLRLAADTIDEETRVLEAALYHPVWTSAIHAPADLALGLVDFALLAFWKWPPWLVVILSAVGGAVLAYL